VKPASAKAKGRVFQNFVASEVRATFCLPDEDCRPAVMGENGADLKLSSRAREVFPFAIEAKKVEALNVWEALKQAEANAAAEGLTPALVFSRNRSPAYVCLRLETFLELAQAAALYDGALPEVEVGYSDPGEPADREAEA
jgi:hypothetical protein